MKSCDVVERISLTCFVALCRGEQNVSMVSSDLRALGGPGRALTNTECNIILRLRPSFLIPICRSQQSCGLYHLI
jgi:hypothetical protein